MPRLSRLDRSIRGRTAIVTGAASGIGRATAHLFADEGASVAVVDVQADGVARVVKEIQGAGGTAEGWDLDVRDFDRFPAVISEVAERFGGLDILINNAGVSRLAPIAHEDYDVHWNDTITINLSAQAQLIRAALPRLEASECARIVNVASTEALGGQRYISAYTASKHGVVGLTRSLAIELADRGITVNCICPGPIRTGMTEAIPEEAKTKFAHRRVPLNRYGEPEEVAHMTLSLVLPAASYVTGTTVVVDGGFSIQN